MSDPRIRIPLMESLLDAGQAAFTGTGRELRPEERRLLVTIFGQSVNLDPVRLAPTDLGVQGRPYTFANTIRIPRGTVMDAATLVHEMTHVWQYQTRGTGYLSNSVVNQLTSGQGAYDVTIVPGQSIDDYNVEQQAMIVQKYYENDPQGWNADPDVLRMIGEVRRARPLSALNIRLETLYGPMRQDPFAPMPGDPGGPSGGPSGGTVPLFRIEWK